MCLPCTSLYSPLAEPSISATAAVLPESSSRCTPSPSFLAPAASLLSSHAAILFFQIQ